MRIKTTVLAVSLVALLCGCTAPLLEPVKKGVAEVDTAASDSLEQLRKGEVTSSDLATSVRHVDNAWLPVTKVDVPSAAAEAALGRTVTVNRSFNNIKDAAYYLTSLTGTTMDVSMPGGAASGAAEPPATGSSSGASSSSPPSGMGSMPSFASTGKFGSSESSSSQDSSNATPIVYNGSVAGFLDLITSRYGMFWEWDNVSNKVDIFKTKTKVFRLVALPGDTSMSSVVSTKTSGGESSGAGGGGSDTSSAKSEIEAGMKFSGMSVWSGIKENITNMLSPLGRISVTPATGSITVDDTPVVLERVEKFVNDQNMALSRQVVINVRVLAVTLSNSKEYGIDWTTVYKTVGSKLNVGLANSFGGSDSASKLTFKVLPGSPWNTSQAVVDALAKQGRVSQVTSASMVTINNQPAPIQVGRQIGYLASSTTTLGTNGSGTSVSLTPGQVTTGFSMSVLPHILDNSKLMLQYSGNLSFLNDMGKVTSGTSTIQTPDVDVRSFLQRVIMNSNETLVVAGFEQFDVSGSAQGTGGAENALFGGGMNSSHGRTVLVVLVQPVLLNGK